MMEEKSPFVVRPNREEKEAHMRKLLFIAAVVVLLNGVGGCSYLFYPRAGDFYEKAKGANSVETLMNLIGMMETSAKASKGGKGMDQALDDLHNQFHAFDDSLCCVEKAKRETPAHALAVTHNKELWAIFKRVWKFQDTQPQRDQHLDLFITELQELRGAIQAL